MNWFQLMVHYFTLCVWWAQKARVFLASPRPQSDLVKNTLFHHSPQPITSHIDSLALLGGWVNNRKSITSITLNEGQQSTAEKHTGYRGGALVNLVLYWLIFRCTGWDALAILRSFNLVIYLSRFCTRKQHTVSCLFLVISPVLIDCKDLVYASFASCSWQTFFWLYITLSLRKTLLWWSWES